MSLHSHTMYSEESVESIPRHIARVPYLARILRDTRLDLNSLYWTPPLAPRQAYRLEEKQIHRRFQLPALVSLTDHDDIRAGTLLRVLERFRDTPISTEWSVPFGQAVFHLGIHNLPASCAAAIMSRLKHFTFGTRDRDSEDELSSIFSLLNSYSDVLIVLNHPLWDEEHLGAKQHADTLSRFLTLHRRSLHALELNGLRPWRENKQVLRLGQEMRLPVISGGDRHGLEPNSILNLSRENTFGGFVQEIRQTRSSHMVLMPQYREPHRLRMIRMTAEILGEYRESPGRTAWADRVFVRHGHDAAPVPLSSLWQGTQHSPKLLQHVVKGIQLTQYGGVRFALRLALGGREWLGPNREPAL